MFVPISKGKLIKSKKYRDWILKNLPVLQENLKPVQDFPIQLDLVIYSNDKWLNRNDIDNCIKPIVDLLVKAEIIPDDTTQYIQSINIRHVWMIGSPLLSISYYSTD